MALYSSGRQKPSCHQTKSRLAFKHSDKAFSRRAGCIQSSSKVFLELWIRILNCPDLDPDPLFRRIGSDLKLLDLGSPLKSQFSYIFLQISNNVFSGVRSESGLSLWSHPDPIYFSDPVNLHPGPQPLYTKAFYPARVKVRPR